MDQRCWQSPFTNHDSRRWIPPRSSSNHLARILRLCRLYRLERLFSPGHRAHNVEDIPLVLRARFVLYLHHVHLLQQLVIPRAEAAFAFFQNVESNTFLQVLDQWGRFRALGLTEGLRDDLDADIVAPGLVVRRALKL